MFHCSATSEVEGATLISLEFQSFQGFSNACLNIRDVFIVLEVHLIALAALYIGSSILWTVKFSLPEVGVPSIDDLEANNIIRGVIDVKSLHQGHAWEGH